jgi:serine/threonine protein kinase
LQQFFLGRLSPEETESLAEHVASCAHCVVRLEQMQAEDVFVTSLQDPGMAQPEPPDEMVEHLIARAALLRPEESGSVTAGRGVLEAVTPPADTTKEVYDFLAPPQQPGEIGRLGPYRVLTVLGVGGMGVVFVAEDAQLQRRVALKVLRPGLLASTAAQRRFLREAQATARLTHDHLVTILHIGEDRGVPFLAMPLLEGESLDARLQREGRLPIAEVLRIGGEIAEGLAAAHEQGLIHRDIKPSNIWLEQKAEGGSMKDEKEPLHPDPSSFLPPSSFRVKILDFGLARSLEGDAALTQTGVILGTPAYMAPEQAHGEPQDARCDLFSLGCVLYRMATGEVPFKGTTTMATLRALELEQPRPPHVLRPEVPRRLSQLILQLLAKRPDARLPSARAVAEALAANRDSRAEDAHPVRRRKRRLVLAAVVVLGGLGLATYLVPVRDDNEAVGLDQPPPAGVGIFGPAAHFDTGLEPRGVAVADFNRDGNLDLVVTNRLNHTVSVFLGNGDGSFQRAVHYLTSTGSMDVTVGDFNGDGNLDLVVANRDVTNDGVRGSVSVLLGNGDGTFQKAVNYPAGPHPTMVAVGDFNGDGKPDLAVADGFHDGGVSVLLGKGDGTFRAAVFYPTGIHCGSVVAADVNGDGKLDLVARNGTSNTVSVLLGKGNGTFLTAVHHPTGPATTGLAVGDFNGDGKLDLVVTNSGVATVSVFLGNGDGTFGAGVDYATGKHPYSVAVADFDGDGTLDLAVTNYEDTTISVLRGNGDGTFQPALVYHVGTSPYLVAVGDFNRDGRPDLAVCNRYANKVAVLLNRSASAGRRK